MIVVSDNVEAWPLVKDPPPSCIRSRRSVGSMIQQGIIQFITQTGIEPTGVLLSPEAASELIEDFGCTYIDYRVGVGKFFRNLRIFETNDVRVAVV